MTSRPATGECSQRSQTGCLGQKWSPAGEGGAGTIHLSSLACVLCSLYTLGGVASRQVDKYEPEEDRWTDGSWPSLRC